MSAQVVTAELQRWILERTQAGLSADAMLDAMLASGWKRKVALAALDDARSGPLARIAPGALPEPALADASNALWAGDREVSIVMALKAPRVVVFGGFLDESECDELVALARDRLARSQTVATAGDAGEVNPARTSDGMFFERGENALVARIEARIAALLHWPLENGEGLQILRYRSGAEYKPHYDYFDESQPGASELLSRGGQRVATLVMYLNSPPVGGATLFPDLGLEVMPVRGNAVFFSYERADPLTRTLHAGSPVPEGEKWVATKWMRAGRFD